MAKEQETKTAAPEQAGQQARGGPRVQMLRGGGPVSDIYVDGIAGVVARAGVVKLDLYQAVGFNQKSGVETRRLSHRLVMPLAALPELIRAFQNIARTVQAQAQAHAETQSQAAAAAAPEAAGNTSSGGKGGGASKKKK